MTFFLGGPVSTVSQTGLVTHTGRNTTYTQVSFHSSVYYKVFAACTECSVYCLAWWQRHFNDVSHHNIIIFVPTRQKSVRVWAVRHTRAVKQSRTPGWLTADTLYTWHRFPAGAPNLTWNLNQDGRIPYDPWEGHSCVGGHWGEHAGPPRPRPADPGPTFISGQNWGHPCLLWPREWRASLLHTDMISCEEMCGALVVPLSGIVRWWWGGK